MFIFEDGCNGANMRGRDRRGLIAMVLQILMLMSLALLTSRVLAEPLRLGADLPYIMLLDEGGKLTPEQVAALPAQRFRPMNDGVVAGFTRSAAWLRVPIPQALKDGAERYLEIRPSYLDSVRLYEPQASGWRLHEAGDLQAFSKRDLKHRNFVFRILPQGDLPLLIRVETSSSMVVLGDLWLPSDFAEATQFNLIWWGAYFGAMVLSILFLIGASIMFRSRKLAILSASSTVIGVHIVVLQGFPAQLLEQASPALLSSLVGIGSCLTVASGIFVIRTLLTEGRNRPYLDRLLVGLTLFVTFCTVSVPLDFYGKVASLTRVSFLVAGCIGLVLALGQLKEKRLHQYVLAASLVYLVAVFIPFALVSIGAVSASIGMAALWYASIPYSSLMCIAVLLEIHQEYQTWKRDQAQALVRAQNDERILEEKVRNRTADLTAAREELQSALDSERRFILEQKQFVSMVSHEFRTPLAILDSAAINLSAVPPRDTDELDDRTAQMRRAIQRLNHLVDNCLAGDRIEHGAFNLQTSDIDIADVVQEAAQLVTWSPKHQFHADISAAPPTWCGDPALIRIALSNLIDNAVKYSQDGVVLVVGRQEDDYLTLAVTNTGAGIPSEEMARIFDKYVRAERRGHGVGLGLFVSRKIAQLHGGDITVQSKRGDTTTFHLKIGRIVSA